MKGLFALPLAGVVVVTQPCLPSAREICPSDLSALRGGQVYVLNDANLPIPFSNAQLRDDERTLDLFYVVRSSVDRQGAIVIKWAAIGKAINGRHDRVKLVRKDPVATACSTASIYPGSWSVKTAAYADYHDLGKESGPNLTSQAKESLGRFHTSYGTDGPTGCRATDTKMGADGFYEKRNNRSQFSFDTTVVDNGHDSPIYQIGAGAVAWTWNLVVTPAIADTDKRLDQYVEIKRYRTQQGFACIPFSMTIRGTRQLLRVNDLEAREAGTRAREFRAEEIH